MQIQCAGSSLGHMRKRSDLSFDELSWLKLSKIVSVSHVCLLSDMLAYMIHISIISPCNMHAIYICVCVYLSLSYVYIWLCVCVCVRFYMSSACAMHFTLAWSPGDVLGRKPRLSRPAPNCRYDLGASAENPAIYGTSRISMSNLFEFRRHRNLRWHDLKISFNTCISRCFHMAWPWSMAF